MNFAKNLLGKYGWKDGDGLGKNSDGITKPLKANYKFDNAGLGHNKADEMNNHWWEHTYNKAAANINISKNNEKSVNITTKSDLVDNIKEENLSSYGGCFRKSLANEDQEIEIPDHQVISPLMLKIVSDEELFKACGGRTAHKGARHGLKLSGKLNRIEEQEKELVRKLKSTTDSSQIFKDYADCKSRMNAKKLKRLKRKKNKKSKRKSIDEVSVALESTRINSEEQKEEKKEERKKEKHLKSKLHKLKLVNGKVEKKKKEKLKLKKVEKKLRVKESKDNFLKKMAIEEVAISFDMKKKRHSIDNDDNISVHSYRDKDELSQSDDDDDGIHKNVFSQISEKLNKRKKQKIVVENLTEFQISNLRNAHVPFVEVKQSNRKKDKKDKAKLNALAKTLDSQMCIS